MSANICDVSKIQDEDVLRKMWQDTEDFGRKKEIRAHMYKVREARLKDLYSSGTESQTQVSVQKTSSSKSSNVQTMHADSLADHSFMSLKSKEVRDSESPTRDHQLAYNNKINATEKYGNTGWTITSSEDTSKDGKTHSAVRTATTSGTEKIDKGVSNYAAKAEQKASVYQDGDANNFTRAVGMSDASTVHQEASGGDEFSSFKSSATTSKSSSKSVKESQSKSGDTTDYSMPKDACLRGTTTTTRGEMIPANAKTVMYTETKTLPDGSKVTTTRYETIGGSSETTTSSSSSSTVQKSSSTAQQSSSSSKQHITSSSDQQQRSIADSGVNTVDYKKAIKLSEDFARNINVSDNTSSKSVSSTSVQQEISRDSKHSEASSKSVQQQEKLLDSTRSTQKIDQSKAIETSKHQTETQRQDICDVNVSEFPAQKRKTPEQEIPTPTQKIIYEVKPIEPPARGESSPPKAKPFSKEPEPYEQPERRQLIKPSKDELEVATKATTGQYDTTYRSDFTNKKIHVEVSATHDAFVRSLRALTPDDLKQSGTRSLRNSNTSLRGSQSPEKMRHPSKASPERPYSGKSPDKCFEPRGTTPKYSPDRVTSYNSDTITRRNKEAHDSKSYRSSTLTRDSSAKKTVKSRSRSASPTTTTTSDFEFVSRRESPQVTDLRGEDTRSVTRSTKTVTETTDSRPSTLNYSKKSKKITERPPTSPLVDLLPSKRTPSPSKEVTTSVRRTSWKEEQQQRQERILRRSDTYEERCRQILGIPEKKKPERNVSDIINTDRRTHRTSSRDKITSQEVTRKPSLPDAARGPSKSPEKSAVNGFPDKKSPQISEFPSQIIRSPERKPLAKYPERQSPTKDKPTISEFPSQIKKSPEKQPLQKYPQRTSPTKEAPKISEFPSQIRRSPEREPSGKYPEKRAPVKEAPTICEFPSQIRKTPEREALERPPERKSPRKEAPKIAEFPAQIRKTPEREPLPEYPEKKALVKEAPTICEFPSQIRKTPEREALERPPERKSPPKEAPKIAEFPAQIRKTPEREPLPEYPKKKAPVKEAPTICEFPSQIRKTPEREALERPSERKSPPKEASKIAEFPAQIQKTPEREPLPEYPEKMAPVKEAPTICEFPSQIRKTPEREPFERPPERKSPPKEAQKIAEFPAQIRKTPEREPSAEYPEKKAPVKEAPTICEFPSQIRKTPEREPLERTPERKSPLKEAQKIAESQIRKTPEREPLPEYPEKRAPFKEARTICEFPSQIRKTPEREALEKPPDRKSPPKEGPKIAEFPAQIRKSPERQALPEYPEKKAPVKEAPTICEFPSQIRKTPEREALSQYPEKPKEAKEPSKISEFPSQARRSPERETIPSYITENIVTTTEDVTTKKKKSKKLSEFPSQTKKAPKPTPEDKVLQETMDYLSKDRIPIDEPMFTKKFIAELGSDDECEITVDEHGNTKINTIDDEELYLQETQNITHKTVKKDSPERQFIRETLSQERQEQTIKQQIDDFISTERNDIYRTTESRKSSPDLRRSPERGILKHTSQFDEKAAKTSSKKKLTDDQIKTQTVETLKIETVKTKHPKTATTYSTTKKHLVRDSSDTKVNVTTTRTATKEVREVKDIKPRPVLSKTPSNKSIPPTKCAKTCCDIKLETITKSSSTDSKVTKKFIQKPEPSVTPKRHVVTTTIIVSPKVKKETTTTTRAIKNITNRQTAQTKPKTFTMPAKVAKLTTTTKKVDVENIENTDKVTQKKIIDKLVRTTSDHTVKSPARPTKPELIRKTPDDKSTDKKCITTKSILINSTIADEREIIVDLLRSTSTREERNTVCPIPVKSNDIKGVARYPDQVTEPDDFSTRHTPRKLANIPIDECEDVSDFTGVTEVTTEDVSKEATTEETVDESLLSVNEKVSKFTQQKQKPKNLGPAPKIERPILIIDEKLESDECLLSVSEKVNKFVNKAEIHERPRSPRCQNIIDITDLDENDESLMSVSDKVTHFVTTAENVKKPQTSTIKVEKTDLTALDESLRTDECLLSVSDKVTKFITTAETLTTKKDAVTSKTKRPSKESVTIEPTYTRTSPQRQTTPKNADRISPTRQTSIKEERRNSRKDSSSTLTRKESSTITSDTTEIEITPKTSRPTTKPLLSGTTQLRSTESIRKAKALFENMATGTENREVKIQKDILSRPSVFDAKKKPETVIVRRVTPDRDDIALKDIGIKESTTSKNYGDTRRKLSFPSSDEECKTTTTTDYRSAKNLFEKARTSELDELGETKYYPRSRSPDNLDVPGYMKPLDRSLRPNSPHRSTVTDTEESVSKPTTDLPEMAALGASKFGVTLRRTDSGRNFTSTVSSATTERKKSLTTILKNHEIEEIYELDILDELLETTVGYDLRRRIRAQIRLVKSLMSEDKLKIINLKVGSPSRDAPEMKVFTKKSSETRSPTREVPDTRTYTRKPSGSNFTEYQTKYIRKSSADTRSINNHLYEHTNLVENKDLTDQTTEYQSSYSRKSSSAAKSKSRETSPETKPCRREKSPEKSSKFFQTDLKKVGTNTKSTKDDKPDWITNRTLRKTAETPSPSVTKKYSSSSTPKTTSVTKEIKSSGGKDIKSTDVITSSYGVGPMDENGSPLFGLKALRTQNKIDQSKVQGTVVRSQFFSENGQEPVGEISVTKYSTDPADLSSDEEVAREDGLLSKTTTQKFGYKGTPSYKSVTTDKKQFSEIENENRTKKSSTKVTRRGSVKEMTQKFLDNTVDSLKIERQTYPKAGLILRTSSFKDNSGSCSREESPTEEHTSEMSSMTTVRTSTSKTTSADQTQKGQTFLTNKSKVIGMQDIVSRMQDSNKETREGDTLEDTEARSLLNKFLGSQVILSGIEGCSSKQAASHQKMSSTKKATTKITTTITALEKHHKSGKASTDDAAKHVKPFNSFTSVRPEGGKPRTVTRTFTHPIAAADIADIWDEETLRLLLDQSSDYDERRILRARLKDAMAEKEVCGSFVEEATNSTTSTSTSHSSSTASMSNNNQAQQQGESLLLPLLQGLLDTNDASEHANNHNPADSGTECGGEDLRSGLIVEVQSALDKLSACLSRDATDITNERRESLLQLVTKLQANLVNTNSTTVTQSRNSERRSSGQNRFSKRKQRQNRHTVGVTSEELEDARRLMEEFALPLQKQNSESAVQRGAQGAFRPVKFQLYKPLHIKNSTAKPFNSSNNSSVSHTPSGASSTVDTPTEPSESLDLLFSEHPVKSPTHQPADQNNHKYIYRQSISLDQNEKHMPSYKKQLLHQTISLDYNKAKDLDLMAIHQAVQQAAATKQQLLLGVDSETDEDSSTLKAAPQLNTVDLFYHTIPKSLGEYNNVNQQPDLLLQSNISRDDSASSIDKENRFNNKKLKMKRANTIDIPKPMKCYVDENESEDDEGLERRQSNYIQLRGPLNVGKFNNNKIVPSLEPKTESDKKFMAFINRQNSEKAANSMVKSSIWDNHQTESAGHGSAANWNSKFGNIKTNFERSSSTESNTSSRNSARSFWKSADDAHTAGVITYNGPKISKQSARNLQQMFEEKQKQAQSVPWAGESQNIVKGSLKVDAKIFEQSKNKCAPNQQTTCTSVNMFSHAPLSAFKPIQKSQINVVVPSITSATKTPNITPQSYKNSSNQSHSTVEPPTPETPLFLYSPKPFNHASNSYSPVSAAATSPTVKQTPWNQTGNDSRVRNIAVAKFEAAPSVPTVVNTRKKSTEKVAMPKYLQQSEEERVPANYISYSSATIKPHGGSVQKISGKYNNLKDPPASHQRHQSAFATVPQSNSKFPVSYQQLPYTHTITYSQPKVSHNNYNHNQVEEAPRSKPEPKKLEQSRIYQAPPKLEPHIVYNNVNSKSNYLNRQEERPYNARKSPYQNGQHLEYTTYTNQHHLPPVSSVPPPQMHYNELYQQRIETSPPKYESQMSEESVHEYNAVSSRVMTGPVSQQAVNVNQNGPMNRNQHDLSAAFNLKSTLQNIEKVRMDTSPTPPKKAMPNVMVNDKPMESLEINERGESIVTSKFHIAVKPSHGQILSKSDSWNQICQSTTPTKPSPRSSPNTRSAATAITKSKSTHMLALPKQFEAGMSRDEMQHKKQTMEAYFAGSKSPKLAAGNKLGTINRTKTSQKMSVMRQASSSSSSGSSGGLSRSRTLPDIVCADLLDESNVDEAFEDLFKAKGLASTQQSFTEGPVTTTQVSTTKVTSQQQASKKPMSPFAKFKQLDRANSLNTPPSTPKTPGGVGGGPMFKFTDPQLSRSASTIKERLLQWCQMKTKEYENIQLDNFSGSWADGLAFCALIHHFLPDAFDYTKLTPNNRRYNFTLAFQIAEEKADIFPLLDVEDMVATRRPDWKCVFTYVQSIYRRFKDED